MPRYKMLIDSEKCLNCKACVVACQQRNHVPYGHSRNWIRETPDPSFPGGVHFQPGACMHCDDAPCVRACPTEATWKNSDGVVMLAPERCVGCGACIDACPYNARFRHPETHVVDKCDYCGNNGCVPACVAVCPTGCRIFGDADDPASPVAEALASRQPIYVTPENMDPKPSLAYLDHTTPDKLPAVEPPVGPMDSMGPLSKTLTWAGGATLALLAGTFGRQLLKSSEKEEQEMNKKDAPASKEDKQ